MIRPRPISVWAVSRPRPISVWAVGITGQSGEQDSPRSTVSCAYCPVQITVAAKLHMAIRLWTPPCPCMGLALNGHNQESVHLPTGTPCWGGGTGVEFCASVGPTPLRALCRFPRCPPCMVDHASALSSIASVGLAVPACWPVERY